jgi:hypothetical protein
MKHTTLIAAALGLGLIGPNVPVRSQERPQGAPPPEPFDFKSSGAGPSQGVLDGPRMAYRAAEAKFSGNAFDPGAERLLRGMEAFTTRVFNVPSLHFERAVTQRVLSGPQWGDVLVAKWSIDEAFGKGSIILTNTPYFSDYSMRLSDCRVESQAGLIAFLHALMAPRGGGAPPGKEATPAPPAPAPASASTTRAPAGFHLPPTSVSVPASFPAVPYFQGSRLGTQSTPMIADFGFAGILDGKDWYIHFGVGNNYNAGARDGTLGFIPERFPPLTDLVKSWGSGQIRREVGREVRPFEVVPAFTYGRDEILIAELARRGLSGEQMSDLLTDVKPTPEEYKSRLQSLISGVIQSGKGGWLDVFQPAVKAYDGLGPIADAAMSDLFGRAANQGCPAAVEQQALDVLKKGVFSHGPFAYLGRCSTSLQTIATIEGLSPGDDAFEKSKAGTIAMIRQHIANPRRFPVKPGAAK